MKIPNKSFLFSLTLFFLIFATLIVKGKNTPSSESDLIGYEDEIYIAFNPIDKLVSYIQTEQETSYADLSATNSSLVKNVIGEPAIANNSQELLKAPFLSPFLWGCCFGGVGIILVAVSTKNDNEQIRQSINGCIISGAVSAVLGVMTYLMLYYAMAASS